jgi:NTE family protein
MLGLALEGGGAKGAFHIGVVKALLEQGYHFDGISGTSIGAINGALIAQGDFDSIYKLWENMDSSLLFDIEEPHIQKIFNKQFDADSIAYLRTKIKSIVDNKGLDTSKIKALLDNIIDEPKLRKSPIDFGMVTVSLTDFKPLQLYKEDIPEGQMTTYLMASANFPVFKIEPIDGKYYIDGGLYDNCPINLLIRKGCTEIIAVRTFGVGINQKVKDKNVNITYITPSESLGNILHFNPQVIQKNLKLGYFDAMRVMKGLKGRKYYITASSDNIFFEFLLSLPDDVIIELGKHLKLSPIQPKRLLFEKIIPSIITLLKLDSTSTYQEIVIGIAEYAAEMLDIERFNIYSFKELVEIIKKAEPTAQPIKHKTMVNIFKQMLSFI